MDAMSIAVLVVLAVAVAFVLASLPAVCLALLLRACRQPLTDTSPMAYAGKLTLRASP
jgi:hypothetical protein